MYLARPIQIKDPACLVCHSTPDAAPRTMIDTYGSVNGFGWKVNDIIGAQVVSIPVAVPLQRANYVFKIFLVSLGAIFIFTIIMSVLPPKSSVTRLPRPASTIFATAAGSRIGAIATSSSS